MRKIHGIVLVMFLALSFTQGQAAKLNFRETARGIRGDDPSAIIEAGNSGDQHDSGQQFSSGIATLERWR
jgi:hypothetical protein